MNWDLRFFFFPFTHILRTEIVCDSALSRTAQSTGTTLFLCSVTVLPAQRPGMTAVYQTLTTVLPSSTQQRRKRGYNSLQIDVQLPAHERNALMCYQQMSKKHGGGASSFEVLTRSDQRFQICEGAGKSTISSPGITASN
jgi:hypothetical protein